MPSRGHLFVVLGVSPMTACAFNEGKDEQPCLGEMCESKYDLALPPPS